MVHRSVLLHEIIESLHPEPGQVFVDATFGGGGHSRLLAERLGTKGRLIALDQDETVFREEGVNELKKLTQFTPVTENFRHVGKVLRRLKVKKIHGALFDLGLSSDQLERSGRGFSFQRDEPLLMTFKEKPKKADVTATTIVNSWSEESIATILKGFGEERFARSIATAIITARKVSPIETTGKLVEVIHDATPSWYHRGRTHFATRTFQSLRMAANDELGAIEKGIEGILPFLHPGCRLSVITFHSVEDRLVKHLFRRLAQEEVIRPVTKKPIIPSAGEVSGNPRARSAKLRVVEKS